MAKMNKGTKKKITIGLILAALFFFVTKMLPEWRLQGTWNGTAWKDIKAQYPGIQLAAFSNTVTVSSRPDLKGTLSGNTITWNTGTTWTRS